MTDGLAVLLGSIIVVLIGVDYIVADFEYSLFLIRKLVELAEYLAFWR